MGATMHNRAKSIIVALVVGAVFTTAPASASWHKPGSGFARAQARAVFPCTSGPTTKAATNDLYKQASGTTTDGTTLIVGKVDTSSTVKRIFIEFSTIVVPSHCAIATATLSLTHSGTNFSGHTLDVQRVNTAWSEASPPSFSAAVSGTVSSVTCCSGTSGATYTWDVKTLLTENGGQAPNGFRIDDRVTVSNEQNTFNSRSSGGTRPVLTITWS